MDFFNTPYGLLVLILSTLAFVGCGTKKNSVKLFLCLNLFWVAYLLKIPVDLLIFFVLFLVLYYFCVSLFCRYSYGFSAIVPIAIAIVFWGVAKYPGDYQPHNFILPLIGVPYALCKLISYATDFRRGLIKNISLVRFLVYMCYFPTFLSGPIPKYNSFSEINTSNRVTGAEVASGLNRIALGMVKRNFLAVAIYPFALPYIAIDSASAFQIIAGIYIFGIYLYFDFSGCSDIAIGMSRIFGIDIPENFNNPFLARNPQDFWARWHISLCKWLYEYLFAPIYTLLLRWFPVAFGPLLASVSIFITFTISGVWHGLDLCYFREGVLHATALFVFINFDGYMKRCWPQLRKKMQLSNAIRLISTTATLHYVLFSFMLFSLDSTKLLFVYQRLILGE